ncbi:hypothetical protein E2553_09445 [Paraburkholderia dipogonis]|uniref:O-antigen ligase domain-containing protein n=1 Tax=Paraburkholderia dipogonis TaxID=1211383 RepID=A0A4Y8N619_9BURK|nr:O-antigen ligase family protein [Paraburkholderia dipogonis]TFE45214.1 hypothetical protein E2553_09445 [Paraburkholderia dipogonis]
MKQSISSHADLYYFIWAFAMPVTSVLIMPSVQGTTLGYLMCFLSLPVALACAGTSRSRYVNLLIVAALVWTFFFLASQLADSALTYEPDLTKVVLIDNNDVSTFVLRKSLFTQTIYLAAVVLYASYVYIFYKPSWQQWLLASAAIFAAYGIYEVIYFIVMGRPGDFISNRGYGADFANNGVTKPEGAATGTSIQRIDIAGLTVQRLKSLTGEPSMYAMSMFPFWVYFNAMSKRRLPVWIIGASLVMSTSSTAFIGYVVYFLIRLRKIRFHPIKFLAGALVLFVVAYLASDYIGDLFQQMVVDKLDGTNVSGAERSDLFHDSVGMWASGSLANQLFGVGFGYIRSTDLFSTLLVNAGVVGLALVSVLILYPAFKLDWSTEGTALRQCCVTTWVMMMISVPEFSYLAPWTFVAIAYARVRADKLAARRSSGALPGGRSVNDRRLTTRSRL